MKYDFAGWVTKNDIQCDDGVIIRKGAFVNSPETVPLYWEHDNTSPDNLLGNMTLVHSDEGVYGYGRFNNTPSAENAKEAVRHKDIVSMSIRANNLVKQAANVVGGVIKEVSLVTRGANPGAFIEEVLVHSGNDGEEALIWTGLEDLIHAADTVLPKEDKNVDVENKKEEPKKEKTLGDVIETMNEDQKEAMEIAIGLALDARDEEEEDEEDNIDEDGVDMKHNAFEDTSTTYTGAAVISKEKFGEIVHSAMDSGKSLSHAAKEYGISNIELLFPDAKNTQGVHILEDKNTNVTKILSSIRKTPFSFVKTIIADLNDEYMRAHGYVTGTKKYDDVFKLLSRKVEPTTIFKRQKLDRDDIIDITDVNVVQLVQGTLRGALEKELVRAILVGDGRLITDKDKIDESKIIPIAKDSDLYTKKYKLESVDKILEAVMFMLTEYQGEGTPSLYCSPTLAIALKLMKSATGKYLFGDIPTYEVMASKMGVKEIVPTSILKDNEFIVANLSDYSIGTNAGGEVTSFDDFDIDFNQYKYLIETRLSGALTIPNSAFYVTLDQVVVVKPTVLTAVVTDENGTQPIPPVKPEGSEQGDGNLNPPS